MTVLPPAVDRAWTGGPPENCGRVSWRLVLTRLPCPAPERNERSFPAGETAAQGSGFARLSCLPAAGPPPGRHHGGGREGGPRRGGPRLGRGHDGATLTDGRSGRDRAGGRQATSPFLRPAAGRGRGRGHPPGAARREA